MANLRDIVVKTETVTVGDAEFSVGPLTAADILGIYGVHRDAISVVFERNQDGLEESDLFLDVIATFPEIVAEVIARASGDLSEEAISVARRLDVGVQLMALEKIGNLTVESAGGLGNLVALVQRLMAGLGQKTVEAKSHLSASSAASENNAPS
ncbi:phage pre-tape measure protein [Alterisphingorhabdus coralli]|uniref:Tail assembly chaperone n=1 Tax=Alterisphingorhabdus coralli TaxID=3071408 RepID=A0AA97I1Q9_9SPHN|nr:hypothetical protein [Parasphingorhabdus sp. SCSIO 66989]WOE76322.1 hypothetical protein RB602_06315 [Parasphingorhabdus sp. SCSIO 66989]